VTSVMSVFVFIEVTEIAGQSCLSIMECFDHLHVLKINIVLLAIAL